jgi:membrane-associated protein
MEDFLKQMFAWICIHADHAGYFLFGLLLLSGLFLPVSEDLTIIIAGLDGDPFPYLLLFMVWLGCLLSAWETYWIGRLFGNKIFTLPVVRYLIKPKHLKRAEQLIKSYGIYSFLIGRFFPGGVRNALFLTSGFTHMPFPLFIMRDLLAGTLTTAILFSIGYLFGQNLDTVFRRVKEVDEMALLVALVAMVTLLFYSRKRYD